MLNVYIYLDTHLFLWNKYFHRVAISRFFISMSSFGTTRKGLRFLGLRFLGLRFLGLRLNRFNL